MTERDVGVYVHVPFCERVCPYCDFAVVAARTLSAADEKTYVDALQTELSRRRGAFAERRLSTIYLGGGTPSRLTPESVARILQAIRAAFPGEPEEVTLEVNPSTLERGRLPGFRAAGVGRVSVGAQSFDDATLKRLGRAHRAVEVGRTLEACRAAGFEALSLDLIVAVPGQTLAGVERDLGAALEQAPDHLSVYELTLEAGTPFGVAAASGRLARTDEETAARMLDRVEERLVGAGYRRYEISSYARPGREAVHNRRYWQRLPVLGLGMGAVSSDPASQPHRFGVRCTNPRRLEAYLAVAAGRARPEVEVLDLRTARTEAIFLALRTVEGVDDTAFAREFGGPLRAFFSAELDRLLAAALLEEDSAGIRLTPRGRMLSDSVFECFA